MQKSLVFIAFVVLLAVAGIGGFFLLGDSQAPEVTLTPGSGAVSPQKILRLHVQDDRNSIRSLVVQARHNNTLIPVLEEHYTDGAKAREVEFDLSVLGLKDAEISLEITATDSSFASFGRGNSKTHTFSLHIDAIPPRLMFSTAPPNIRRGGTGVILFSSSKPLEQAGVKVGDLFFPAFAQEGKGYLCFFAYPYFMTNSDFNPQLVATDVAGNSQSVPVAVNKMHQEFKHDTIAISQNLLDFKDGEFSQIVPGNMSKIDRFLEVNNLVRRSNAQSLMEIGQDTSAVILWSGPFMQLPRGATRAGFADHRTYTWQGDKVDEQTHLGYDFASTANAPVPAANSGRVIFTGYLGIYGNLVVIDHGLGLQSLYSHLSSIAVEAGQNVNKGDIIGNTGNTGMAVGDHLHFGILISGLEVSPLEWLDQKWIKDNIAIRLQDVGFNLP